MGYKINHLGLLVNDNNTTNISTNSKVGKFHIIQCETCGAKNRISLEAIQRKAIIDEAIKKQNWINKNVGSMINFRCGNCNNHIGNSEVLNKEINIYTPKEYNEELSLYVNNLAKKFK